MMLRLSWRRRRYSRVATFTSSPSSGSSGSSGGISGSWSGSGSGSNPAYVSKHYAVDTAQLKAVITKFKCDFRSNTSAETVELKTCFADCPKERKGMHDNAWKFNIRKDGSYWCHRCSKGGNWYKLKERLNAKGFELIEGSAAPQSYSMRGTVATASDDDECSSSSSSSISASASEDNELFPAKKGTGKGGGNSGEIVRPDQDQAISLHQALVAAIMERKSPAAIAAAAAPTSAVSHGSADANSDSSSKRQTPDLAGRQLALSYLLNQRGLSPEVLLKYGVGCGVQAFMMDKPSSNSGANAGGSDKSSSEWVDRVTVTFPWAERVQVSPSVTSSPLSSNAPAKAPTGGPLLIHRIKHRAVESKGLQRILPKGGAWGFFGWHTVQPHHTEIILTEGEYDAMACFQGLELSGLPADHPLRSTPAISLPNGCNSLPPSLLPLLERFTKIYLWLDNDTAGQDAAEKYAKKLGANRCVIVRPLDAAASESAGGKASRVTAASSSSSAPTPAPILQPKDANDALRMMLPQFNPANAVAGSGAGAVVGTGSAQAPPSLIADMLLAAQPLRHRSLETFAHLREEVLRSIRTPLTALSGTATPSIPTLSAIIKGFRRGELTILTGPTGGGKTTFLSQLSVDFAKAGVPTLWGSFEIKNARLVEKQLQQYYPSTGSIRMLPEDKLEQLADDFEALPFHYMNFHSSTDIASILDAMDFSVYRDDVQHIIIDNLQFLSPRGGPRHSSGFDKFSLQDSVIDEFRRFCTDKNVNIILVIHPRKEDENVPLGISSIFGTAKATQEADVVLILQRTQAGLAVAVKKNRYCGTLGKVDLGYSVQASSFYELSKAESEERARANSSNSSSAAGQGGQRPGYRRP